MVDSSLTQLRALRDSPAEQFDLALRLVAKERNADTVIAAAAVIEAVADERARAPLLARYDDLDQNGARRDPGGAIRIALLRALAPIARSDDAGLFARAAATYEHRYGEVAGDLRAAGVLGLSQVDRNLAGFHAVRLLHDQHTSPMSGEPAVTAARVLAGIGQPLPLYAVVVRDNGLPGEIVGECLRGLTELPASLIPPLIDRYRENRDEVVLLGLYDLLLQHPAHSDYMPVVRDFLRTTALIDLYRSLVATLIAGRDPAWLNELKRQAEVEKHPVKAEILREALPPR
ncbi:MAG: hypothetical protein AB7N70_16840 [Dehalococcoidia bacterium]